jgi:hypothetical protein
MKQEKQKQATGSNKAVAGEKEEDTFAQQKQ